MNKFKERYIFSIEEYGPNMQAYLFSKIFPPRLIEKEYFGKVGKIDKKGNHFFGERSWSYHNQTNYD